MNTYLNALSVKTIFFGNFPSDLKPKFKIFKSSEFGGWQIKRILNHVEKQFESCYLSDQLVCVHYLVGYK